MNSSFGRYGADEPSSEGGGGGMDLANSIIGLVGSGLNAWSSLNERKRAQAEATTLIQQAEADRQISRDQARTALANMATQLGLAKSQEKSKAQTQRTVLVLGLGALLLVGLGGGLYMVTR